MEVLTQSSSGGEGTIANARKENAQGGVQTNPNKMGKRKASMTTFPLACRGREESLDRDNPRTTTTR